MSILGIPYRVVYIAQNFTTGLAGITAKVKPPTGAVRGAFALLEFAEAEFKGMYFFDFITSSVDPEGEWIVAIQDGTNKAAHRISYETFATQSFAGAPNLRAKVESNTLKAVVVTSDTVTC